MDTSQSGLTKAADEIAAQILLVEFGPQRLGRTTSFTGTGGAYTNLPPR
jgi:hypothetical protein